MPENFIIRTKENKLIEKMYENLENKAKFYEYYEYVDSITLPNLEDYIEYPSK